MSRTELRRSSGAIGLALLFGAVTAAVKGNGSGVRDALGNVSAPWLIVPLLAGWWAVPRAVAAGALLGLSVTMAAILGFYAANAVVLDLGPHSAIEDLGLALAPGAVLAPYGAVTGSLFGALGAWCGARRPAAPGWIIAALLVLEPPVALASLRARGIELSASFGNPWVWIGEAALGLLLAAALWRRSRRTLVP